MRKRRVTSIFMAGCLLCSAMSGAGSMQALAEDADTAEWTVVNFQEVSEMFADPDASHGAGVRYVIPEDFDVNSEEYMQAMEDEIRELYAMGYSRLEIENRVDRESEDFTTLYTLVYTVANELGMKIDFRVGGTGSVRIYNGGWAANSSISSVSGMEATNLYSSDAAEVSGGTAIDSSFTVTGSCSDNPESAEIYEVQAIRTGTNEAGGKVAEEVVHLDASLFAISEIVEVETELELSDEMAAMYAMMGMGGSSVEYQYSVSFTGSEVIGAEGETWDIIVYFTMKTGSEDFYSVESAKVFTENVDAIFADETLKELVRANGGYMTSDGGDGNQAVSANSFSVELEQKFADAYGYELKDQLAVIYSGYALPDGGEDRVRNDWEKAFTLLFADYNECVTAWAEETYNSSWRSQVGYSTDMETQQAAMSVGQSDVESLWNASELDSYLSVTSVRNLTGGSITANECAALWTSDYGYGYKDLVSIANASFVAGVNQQIFHVMSFPYSEASTWPGFLDWESALMDWGKTSVEFEDSEMVVAYVNRVQTVLQEGTPKRDILVYIQTYGDDYEIDDAVAESGYTYDIVSDALLTTEQAQTVENGVIDPEGGEYRALVIAGILDGQYMDIRTAETILAYAQAGIPIIVVGEENLPTKTASYSQMEEDDRLTEIFDEIQELGMLTVISSEAELPETLEAIQIEPNLKKEESSKIESYLVEGEDGTSYYYLYNSDEYFAGLSGTYDQSYSDEERERYFPEKVSGEVYKADVLTQTIGLKGSGTPYLMDLWSGEVTPIAEYTEEDGYVYVPVSLMGGESTVIALASDGDAVHVTENGTGGKVLYDESGSLVLRVTESGEYSVTDADGKTLTAAVDQVADSIEITDWHLKIEAETPEEEFGTTGIAGAKSAITEIELDISELKPWSELDGVGEEVVGRGYYTATFTLDGEYDGAIVDCGDAFDLLRVYINGEEVVVNQNQKTADLGGYLTDGENTLTIVTASDYMNQYTANDGPGNAGLILEYGLFGPVTVTPYVNAELAES